MASLLLAMAVGVLALTLSSAPNPEPATRSAVRLSHAQPPIVFEPNRGQADRSIDFLARGSGYTLALRPTEALFVLGGKGRLRMKLSGASRKAQLQAHELLPGKVNYLLGNDRSRWVRGVETYARITATDIYPRIDLVYRGNRSGLEYDFLVRPGGHPGRISLAFDGARSLRLDRSGNLRLDLLGGTLLQLPPFAYQLVNSRRRPVHAAFRILDGRVAFTTGAYDRSRTLVIDPSIVYSTYLGTTADELGTSIKVDSAGSAYIAGHSLQAFQPARVGDSPDLGEGDVFVTKLSPSGGTVVFTTLIGGAGTEVSSAIDIDDTGSAYVTGSTASADFPTTAGAFDPSDNPADDGFVAKLNATGSGFVYSTYLGGAADDFGTGIHVVRATGSVTVSGSTLSSDFPTTAGAYDTSPNGLSDGFVTRLNAAGAAPLVYSSYLGGSGNDYAEDVAVDAEGSSYIGGTTESSNFPATAGAFDLVLGGSADAFAAKLDSGGGALAYATYLGGGGIDRGSAIGVDPVAETAHLAGQTASGTSSPFPTTGGAWDTDLSGVTDAFATKLNSAGNGLAYSTYLGGTNRDRSHAITVDPDGDAHVAGETQSTDFPSVNPAQGSTGGLTDAFVTGFAAAGGALVYSTYLGGGGNDVALGIAADGAGAAYVTGETSSTTFPTMNPAQATNAGGIDAFATKLAVPTATVLRSFSARRTGANSVLRWRTGSEVGLLGFNVFGDRRGLRIRLNRILISAAGGVAGREYSFRTPSRMTRYWLQEVRVDGSRAWRGPAKAR